MDQDAAWYGSRPRLRPHCACWGLSFRERDTAPPSFRPMSTVATVAHLSYCWALVVLDTDSQTRSSLEVKKQRMNTDLRRHFFSERIINWWNKLDRETVCVSRTDFKDYGWRMSLSLATSALWCSVCLSLTFVTFFVKKYFFSAYQSLL